MGHPSFAGEREHPNADLVDIYAVEVAPTPALSWFDGSHDRMAGFVEVGSGMAVSGGIATTNLAALQAHAKMHPGSADLETLLATLGARLRLLHMINRMRAL
jgi:hypothetical protein